MWLAILNAFPKSSSESFSQPQSVLENSGTNLSGFAEVWSQRFCYSVSLPFFLSVSQDSARLKGGSVGAYKQQDNETEKRGTMSKAGHGGFLFTSLYIKGTHQFKIWNPFPLHDHSTGFSLHHRSCQEAHFSLWPCQASSLPKFHLLSQFPWLGWIEAIPSESLFRRCAPKRQPSVSTWLLVDEPPLFMGMKPHIPKLTWALMDCLRTFSSRGLAGWYTWLLLRTLHGHSCDTLSRCGPRGNGDGKFLAHARNPSPDPKSTIKYHKYHSFSILKLEIPKYDQSCIIQAAVPQTFRLKATKSNNFRLISQPSGPSASFDQCFWFQLIFISKSQDLPGFHITMAPVAFAPEAYDFLESHCFDLGVFCRFQCSTCHFSDMVVL